MFEDALKNLRDRGVSFCVVTLVDVEISAPQAPGARAIFTTEGLHFGTIGGGKVELRVGEHAQKLLSDIDSHTSFVSWNLRSDIGMTCGGIVRFFFEVERPDPWTIQVFGAGHVSQAVIPLLLTLDCRIKVVDTRSEWLERLPYHERLEIHCYETWDQGLRGCKASDFYLLLTPGHSFDVPLVTAIFSRFEPRYLGVIGSHTKSAVLHRELKKLGISQTQLAKINCPVGLPLGGKSCPEIALSIAAQLVQARYQRD